MVVVAQLVRALVCGTNKAPSYEGAFFIKSFKLLF